MEPSKIPIPGGSETTKYLQTDEIALLTVTDVKQLILYARENGVALMKFGALEFQFFSTAFSENNKSSTY